MHADGSFSSYYGRYNGSGLNTSFAQDDIAGYAALQCSQVQVPCPCSNQPVDNLPIAGLPGSARVEILRMRLACCSICLLAQTSCCLTHDENLRTITNKRDACMCL